MNKSKITKNKIIDAASQLFAEKGYQAITMKDICEKSGLSRGGVYRYFSSTKEVFLAMLDSDMNDDTEKVEQAIQNKVCALVILDHYLDHEKGIIFGENRGLYYAMHEFAFAEPDQRQYFDGRVKRSLALIGKIFKYGQDSGAFKNFDIPSTALHVIYFFNGMKTSASILTITEEMVNQQLKIVKEMIV